MVSDDPVWVFFNKTQLLLIISFEEKVCPCNANGKHLYKCFSYIFSNVAKATDAFHWGNLSKKQGTFSSCPCFHSRNWRKNLPWRKSGSWLQGLKPYKVGELKHLCKEEWAKIPPEGCKTVTASCGNQLTAAVDIGDINHGLESNHCFTCRVG